MQEYLKNRGFLKADTRWKNTRFFLRKDAAANAPVNKT
jgi:hypothetical protein